MVVSEVCWCSCTHPASLGAPAAQRTWQGESGRYWHVSSSLGRKSSVSGLRGGEFGAVVPGCLN